MPAAAPTTFYLCDECKILQECNKCLCICWRFYPWKHLNLLSLPHLQVHTQTYTDTHTQARAHTHTSLHLNHFPKNQKPGQNTTSSMKPFEISLALSVFLLLQKATAHSLTESSGIPVLQLLLMCFISPAPSPHPRLVNFSRARAMSCLSLIPYCAHRSPWPKCKPP